MRVRTVFFLRLALAAAGGLALPACTEQMPLQTQATQEELAEFRQSMAAHAEKAGDFQRQTLKGVNLGEMTLGWFMHGVLVELSSQNEELYDYFTTGGRDMRTYLKTAFKTQPEKEISNLQAMADEDHSITVLAARYALECLRHIPDGNDPVAEQAKDRQNLASSLGVLKGLLEELARPSSPS